MTIDFSRLLAFFAAVLLLAQPAALAIVAFCWFWSLPSPIGIEVDGKRFVLAFLCFLPGLIAAAYAAFGKKVFP